MRIRFRFVLRGLAAGLEHAGARGADPVWIQITSRNFTLFTDTTEVKGRRLFEDLEGRLAALGSALGEIPQRQFPIEVFLFSKKEEFLEALRGPQVLMHLQSSRSLHICGGARTESSSVRGTSHPPTLPTTLDTRLVMCSLNAPRFGDRSGWRKARLSTFERLAATPTTSKFRRRTGIPLRTFSRSFRIKEYDDDAPPTAFRVQSHRLLRLVLARHGSEFRALLKALRTSTDKARSWTSTEGYSE